MASKAAGQEKVRLKVPVTPEDLAGLKIGTVVYLDGVIYTAREGVYKKIIENGEALPDGVTELSNVNFHCSPAWSNVAPIVALTWLVAASKWCQQRIILWVEWWLMWILVVLYPGSMSPEKTLVVRMVLTGWVVTVSPTPQYSAVLPEMSWPATWSNSSPGKSRILR